MIFSIYLTNLAKYNEGELVGKWFNLPAEEEKIEAVLESIGCGEDGDEYFITDYEMPGDIRIAEYEDIWDLNDTITMIEDEIYCDTIVDVIEALSKYHNLNEILEILSSRDYSIWSDCYDMADVAYQMVEELDLLHGVPESLANYFDYEAYGRDLGLEGRFIFGNGGLCVELY